MNKIAKLLFLLFVGIPFGLAFAQNAPSADAQVSTDKKADEPVMPRGDFFGQALSGHWVFTTEFNFSQEYDDNIFAQPTIRFGDNVSRIAARFSGGVQKKRLRAQFHYYPNYVKYAKYADRDALSHQYMHEIGYKFSGHTDLNWTLSAMRAPGYTNSPFTLMQFDDVVLPVFRPDALQSDATILNASTGVSWKHSFTARDTVSVDLTGNYVQFSSDNGVPLAPGIATKSFSNGATVRWEDEFIPKKKIGLEAGEQYFGFLDPASHSNYQFVKVRYSQSFGRGYQFSIGAGPGRRERQPSATFGSEADSIDYAIDASLTKTGPRGSLGIIYNHGSQLGLTQGSLGSDSISATAMRRVGRRWHLDAGFSYSQTSTESATFVGTSDAYAANGDIGYQFTPDFGITAGYSYILQDTGVVLPFGSGFDRNVYRIGFKYTFQRITSR
jgi:hypothetical protein